MANLYAYKFESGFDYTVYTYSSTGMTKYQEVKQEDVPSNGWITLEGYAFFPNVADRSILPSPVLCFAKDGVDIEGYEAKDEIMWMSIYYRPGMNIIKTKYDMTVNLDPPVPTDYSTPPNDFSSTFSSDKMIDYIG